MKLKVYSMLAASLLLLGSCAEQEEMGTPIQTGDEIHFGLSTPGEVKTRTIYGTPVDNGDGTGYFPIYWEQDDEIAIYCPQAIQPETQLVHYKITPDPNDKSTSSAVTRVGDVGLQWGDRDKEHRFYGFYPASAVKGTETDGRIISEIPVFQSVTEWKDNGNAVGKGKVYTGVPDTKFAYMFAYTAVTPSSLTAENADIPLKFSPLVTILEVEVNGPKSGSPVKVTNVNVTSTDGTALAGNFECLISDRSGKCTPVNDATVTNRVSVSCYDNDKDEFIELGVGDKLKVKLFLLPYTDHDIQQGSLKVTVSTLNGAAKTKTLQTADVISQCVNRVSLPALNANDDTNYWLSNLDPDIYFSELSMPGSFQSAGTSADGGADAYQGMSIEQQFNDGIRVFSFQTTAPSREGGELKLYYAGSEQSTTLSTVANNIKSYVQAANASPNNKNQNKNEFAVIEVWYKQTAATGIGLIENAARERWMKTVAQRVNDWATDNGFVVNPSADMTISDLANKVVVIIRYADQVGWPLDPMSPYIQGGTYSAVFLDWQDEETAMQQIPVKFGNPGATESGLTINVTDVTYVNSSSGNGNISLENKVALVKSLFDMSVTNYPNESVSRSNWYLNNLGGFYRTTEGGRGGDTRTYATDMHNRVVDILQDRTQNAAIGIMLMNFADKQGDSGAKYKSDWLIQTIIDNNFKFALRKKPSNNTRTEYVTRMTSDEDGWDN
jgi:hypothetical protein